VLYAACAITVGEGRKQYYASKLLGVFSPYESTLTNMCHQVPSSDTVSPKKTNLRVFRNNNNELDISFYGTKEKYRIEHEVLPGWADEILDGIYIPVKEMLAHAPGFISLTAKREIAFEEVYVDIIKQTYLPKLKELPNQAYKKIQSDLGKAIGGEIILKGEYFFLKNKYGELEFSLLAEGVRKLALIWLLIQNGSLNPGTLLFWDEPEANLNPSLVGLVVETLLELQRQGVPVFLATHNYVLLKEFDLRKKEDDAVRYISLFRDNLDRVVGASSDLYTGISPNAISDTFSDLYQRDIARALRRD